MHIDAAFVTLALLVALALAFDFMNGFHDAANSIATVVSTRVLKLVKELAGYATLESPHFVVRYKPGVDGIVAREMLEPLEKNHARVTGKDKGVQGKVIAALANTQFRVRLDSGHQIVAHIAGVQFLGDTDELGHGGCSAS